MVGTPSGISLAAEGGAHQSVYEPLIGLAQPGLTSFEPAYADELCEMMRWSFEHLQADDGGAVYLRLSTRPIAQPAREFTSALASDVTEGGYWLVPPMKNTTLGIVASGAVLPEAIEAHRQVTEDEPGAGLLVITSVDRLYRGWTDSCRGPLGGRPSHVSRLLEALPVTAGLVTAIDGHPSTLSWLASVRPHRVVPLGVDRFGQSGDLLDLYREYGLDTKAIVAAAARLLVDR